VQLLERHGRGLRLTEPGRIFAGYAREILGLQEEGLAAARGDADPERARVRVAAVTTAGEHILPVVIVSLRERHPGVDLRLEVGNRERVWGLLAAREADLVIAGRPPRSLDVAVRAVRRNELVVVGPPGVSDPMGATWLLREAGSGTRAACQALLAELDADPATLTLGSNGAVVAGALVGLGVTLVSRDAVAEALAAGRIVELAVPHTPLRRPWHAVSHRHASAAVELLVEHLCAQPGPPATKWRRAQLPRPGRHDGGHGRAAGDASSPPGGRRRVRRVRSCSAVRTTLQGPPVRAGLGGEAAAVVDTRRNACPPSQGSLTWTRSTRACLTTFCSVCWAMRYSAISACSGTGIRRRPPRYRAARSNGPSWSAHRQAQVVEDGRPQVGDGRSGLVQGQVGQFPGHPSSLTAASLPVAAAPAAPRHRPDRARPTRRRTSAVPAPGEAVPPADGCAAGRRTGSGSATSRAPHPAAPRTGPPALPVPASPGCRSGGGAAPSPDHRDLPRIPGGHRDRSTGPLVMVALIRVRRGL
jgi:DNA-binding transcriptional LysR family regulator